MWGSLSESKTFSVTWSLSSSAEAGDAQVVYLNNVPPLGSATHRAVPAPLDPRGFAPPAFAGGGSPCIQIGRFTIKLRDCCEGPCSVAFLATIMCVLRTMRPATSTALVRAMSEMVTRTPGPGLIAAPIVPEHKIPASFVHPRKIWVNNWVVEQEEVKNVLEWSRVQAV